MQSKPAVIVVVANGEVSVESFGDAEVVLVDLDSIRDYETPREDVEDLLGRVTRLPEGDGTYRAARAAAIFGLAHSEPMAAR